MRYLFGFICVLALGVMGCSETAGTGGSGGEDQVQCLALCPDGFLIQEAHLSVDMDPWVESPYEVDLVLDGVTGAFTCGSYTDDHGGNLSSSPTNRTGSGESVASECFGSGFTIVGTPESVEISVTAQDGSWTGSAKASPNYERMPRCPGESELCPPFAVVVVEQQ